MTVYREKYETIENRQEDMKHNMENKILGTPLRKIPIPIVKFGYPIYL